jgi:hypothetical protein
MKEKQREAQRIGFNLEVEIWGRDYCNITNLSTTGMFIHSEKPSRFNEGEGIDLLVKFPGEEEPMVVKAEVARVTAEGIGVRFTNLPPAYAKVIEDCCSNSNDVAR